MSELADTFLLVYAALFPIVNPIGSAPIFLGLTRHCTDRERRRLAWKICVNGFILLLCSLLIGSHVLGFFGITIPVLRIAGGLVVTSFGWTMLQAGKDIDGGGDAVAKQVSPADAFYPLTMPLTVGPGSISVAIALGSQRPTDMIHGAEIGGAAVAGLLAILGTVYFCYRFADRIVVMLGERGSEVLARLSAFILLCIGIQILWTGISSLPGLLGH